jgi:hypothetical protein
MRVTTWIAAQAFLFRSRRGAPRGSADERTGLLSGATGAVSRRDRRTLSAAPWVVPIALCGCMAFLRSGAAVQRWTTSSIWSIGHIFRPSSTRTSRSHNAVARCDMHDTGRTMGNLQCIQDRLHGRVHRRVHTWLVSCLIVSAASAGPSACKGSDPAPKSKGAGSSLGSGGADSNPIGSGGSVGATSGSGGAGAAGVETGGVGAGGATGGSGNLDSGTGGGAMPDAGSGAGDPDAGDPVCTATQHSCACATGSYCLMRGAACISSSSPCPTEQSGCAQCAPGNVCIELITLGGVFIAPDGGACPPPRVILPNAPDQCSTPPAFECQPKPSTCAGDLTCSCAQALCSGTCSEVSGTHLQCVRLVP